MYQRKTANNFGPPKNHAKNVNMHTNTDTDTNSEQQSLLLHGTEETLSLDQVVKGLKHVDENQQILNNEDHLPFQRQNSDPTAFLQRNGNRGVNGSFRQTASEISFRFSDPPALPSYGNDDDDDDEKEGIFPSFHRRWFPDSYETDLVVDAGGRMRQPDQRHSFRPVPRSLKRRMFLFLTEPTTSMGAAIFFFVLIFTIAWMNILMIMQTMNHWQYTPTDCITCGGPKEYIFEDDAIESPLEPNVPCVCPPTPMQWTNTQLNYLVYFFTVEWTLRVLLFEPPKDAPRGSFWPQWFSHLTETTTILDALAIFPYYLETLENTNALMSLRLLRLFRVFQLLRLGQYNTTFLSLTNVLFQSMLYLKLLMIALVFGAALFGSMMYWLEKGSWKYDKMTQQYRFMRISIDGVTEEPSPFTSIPAAFWWFIVTATTCGYGDVYPTTTAGKWVAVGAMMLGVLVVAFPVSVFSELWQREVSKISRHYGYRDDALQQIQGEEDQKSAKSGGDAAADNDDDSLHDIYYSTKAKDFDALLSTMNLSRSSSVLPAVNSQDTDGFNNTKAPPARNTTAGHHRRSASMTTAERKAGQRRQQDQDDHYRGGDDLFVMSQHEVATILNELDTIRASETRIRSLMNR